MIDNGHYVPVGVERIVIKNMARKLGTTTAHLLDVLDSVMMEVILSKRKKRSVPEAITNP